jgi:SSS family solute:Na+ symporter/sodium/proline symporter
MAVFFWERATAAGAVASIASGTAVTVLWNLSGIQFLDAIYPALAVSVVSLILVSLVTPGRISMAGKPQLAKKPARAKGGECEGR